MMLSLLKDLFELKHNFSTNLEAKNESEFLNPSRPPLSFKTYSTLDKILQYYPDEKLRKNIAANFADTQIWQKMKNARGSFWNINDTACPVQIRNFSPGNPPKKRFPDAIGFGFGKCGTGRMVLSSNIRET